MTPTEVLEELANRVEESWGQGFDGPCLLRHLLALTVERVYYDEGRVRNAIRREIFGPDYAPHAYQQNNSIAWWNDEPGRTKEEVAATVRNSKRWLG